jgi:uncharacterized protein
MPPDRYLRPLPRKNPFNQPLWDALARHELVVPKCNHCGDWNWIPYPACRTCLSEDLSWRPVSGQGALMTFSVISRPPLTFGVDRYVVALVELAERPRSIVLLGNVVDVAEEELRIGMPMTIVYEDIPDEDITLWRFTRR